jgi:hypothetical protein
MLVPARLPRGRWMGREQYGLPIDSKLVKRVLAGERVED